MGTQYDVYEWSKSEKRWVPYWVTEDKESAYKIVERMQSAERSPRTKWKIVEITATVIYETTH